MNTWAFTGHVGSFHRSPRPWTTWHAPLVGPVLMKRFKVLSHGGPSTIAKRRMTRTEKCGYHHIYDEPERDGRADVAAARFRCARAIAAGPT